MSANRRDQAQTVNSATQDSPVAGELEDSDGSPDAVAEIRIAGEDVVVRPSQSTIPAAIQAPATSPITRSIGQPSPSSMMPVWPVAMNLVSSPASCRALVNSTEVTILPMLQS